MDPARFGTLVRSLEQRAKRYPRLYRSQVAALAALGYLYVIGLLVALLGLVVGLGYAATHVGGGGAVFAKLLIPLIGLAYVLLRSLWIRVPDLEGIPLPAERFPALAEAIERIRRQVDAPRFRRVLLDGDFNAAVAQRPRFGIIGPSLSDLVLGLPLMQALSLAEFEAVLAHELGHVSSGIGSTGCGTPGAASPTQSPRAAAGRRSCWGSSSPGTRPSSAPTPSCSPAWMNTRRTARRCG
jgi:Zn-dependent protease with chaperone function